MARPKKYPINDVDIVNRIKDGYKFMTKQIEIDQEASYTYRDIAPLRRKNHVTAYDDDIDLGYDDDIGGDTQDTSAVGIPNLLAMNIRTKLAAVGFGVPDWYVKTRPGADPMSQVIVRQFLKDKWRLNGIIRTSNRCLLKRYVAGLGCVAYRWDDSKHVVWEHVQIWDVALDPQTQSFDDLRYAGRRIHMSLRDAVALYGEKPFYDLPIADCLDTKKISVWIYWDSETEAHVYKNTVIKKTANLYGLDTYGRGLIPLLFLEGDLDPTDSIWPQGDTALGAGLQREINESRAIISETAKNAGPMTLVDSARIDSVTLDQMRNGVHNSLIPVQDTVNVPIVHIAGTPIDANLLNTEQNSFQMLQAAQGVTPADLGMYSKPSFATEVAAVQQKAGSRSIMTRAEFERFVSRMAELTIIMEREFGGPNGDLPLTTEEELLWEALNDVVEVYVLEGSTQYKEAQADLQQAMQRLDIISKITPLMMQMGQAVPNIQEYVNDVLRASGKQDVERSWIEMQAPQQDVTTEEMGDDMPQEQEMYSEESLPMMGQRMPVAQGSYE